MHTQAIRYVIHGKEPRNEATGDKNHGGNETRTAKTPGEAQDEQQQQNGPGSSSVPSIVPSKDTSEAAPVYASSEPVANGEFAPNFTRKDAEALMVMHSHDDEIDMQRGCFLAGIRFAPSQDGKDPKARQKESTKHPSGVLAAPVAAVSRISDVSVRREGFENYINHERGDPMTQKGNARDFLHHRGQSSGFLIDPRRRQGMVQDSEEQPRQQQQDTNRAHWHHRRDDRFGSSAVNSNTAFAAGTFMAHEGISNYFHVGNEDTSTFYHQGQAVVHDQFYAAGRFDARWR
jgi:hypothetical protein